ncbi:MAG: hypothetical protein ACI9U2_003821 [Bradymonadia bacterium]|jgi:hypothetical protein
MVWRGGPSTTRKLVHAVLLLLPFLAPAALAPVGVAGPMTLAAGRYAGDSDAGRVWIWLKRDGAAEFGGVAYRWRQADGRLQLDGIHPKTEPLSLTITAVKARTCLDGPPFTRVCLTAAPLPAPAPIAPRQRPTHLRGAWRHSATGGTLTLALTANGRYTMHQAATGDAAEQTHGQWHGDDAHLSLIPDGGERLTYRARRAGPDLFISGGDLPMTVRLSTVDGATVDTATRR